MSAAPEARAGGRAAPEARAGGRAAPEARAGGRAAPEARAAMEDRATGGDVVGCEEASLTFFTISSQSWGDRRG